MKKLYTLLLILILSGSFAEAQSFSVSPNHFSYTNLTLNEYSSATIDFTNNLNENIVFEWDLLVSEYTSGWDFSICDYTTCYSTPQALNAGGHGTMTPVAAGNNGFLKINILAPQTGTAYYKFKVYDTNFPEEADTVEFYFTSDNSLSTNDKEIVKKAEIYPNPTLDGNFKIKNTENYNRISIVSSTGQVIYTKEINQSELTITKNLPKGFYFVELLGKKEEFNIVKKIVVK